MQCHHQHTANSITTDYLPKKDKCIRDFAQESGSSQWSGKYSKLIQPPHTWISTPYKISQETHDTLLSTEQCLVYIINMLIQNFTIIFIPSFVIFLYKQSIFKKF